MLTVKQISPRGGADYGEVRWGAVVVSGEGKPVATYDVLTMVAKTWPRPSSPPVERLHHFSAAHRPVNDGVRWRGTPNVGVDDVPGAACGGEDRLAASGRSRSVTGCRRNPGRGRSPGRADSRAACRRATRRWASSVVMTGSPG
jgi:hypothetical protein